MVVTYAATPDNKRMRARPSWNQCLTAIFTHMHVQ